VPGAVFRDGGNLTYAQVILGLALGKIAIGLLFARHFYETRSERTVYDYLGHRLGWNSGALAVILGLLLNVINASVKLLTASLVLEVMTGWQLTTCAAGVMAFSVLWAGIAGIKTVIWTDLLLFLLFAFGALVILGYLTLALDSSWAGLYSGWADTARLRWLDLSTDPRRSYTLWAALAGAVGLSIALGGTQATWQRIKACRSAADAQRAYNYAALFYALHLVILAVGLGLVAFYDQNPPAAEQAAALAAKPDRVLPLFILTELPVGLSGLLLAALFAAAISTLDTSLAEATDISVRHIYEPLTGGTDSEARYLLISRALLLFWGIAFTLAALAASRFEGDGLLDLTFKLPNYLYGTTFALILLARFPLLRAHRTIGLGTLLSGIMAATGTVFLLQNAGIAFFWWCPASGAVMIMLTAGIQIRQNRLPGTGDPVR
jgi:Na+/proline symporter